MKTHNIFSKVGGILNEINEQYQYLSESPENLNDLELELLSANADFLAEHIKVLKKLNSSKSNSSESEPKTSDEDRSHTKQSEPIEPEKLLVEKGLVEQELPEVYSFFNNPVGNEMPVENVAIEETEKTLEEINPSPEAKEAELATAEEHEPELAEEQPVFKMHFTPASELQTEVNTIELKDSEPMAQQDTVINEVVIEEKIVSVEIPSIADEPEKVPTLNEMMSVQRPQNTSLGHLNKQPVSDLKSIINLNDKLLFIKDLFNGYNLAYSEAIEIINRFDSFEAADNFLKTNYSVKNNWASKQATADKLYELLNRRFPGNQ